MVTVAAGVFAARSENSDPSNSSSMRRTSGSRFSPTAVVLTLRVVRSSSGEPTACSSFWIRRLSAGWET